MTKENAIAVLNSLITINNDRLEGYETASEETDDIDLKILFSEFISSSRKCKQELVREVNLLGGEIAKGTKAPEKFFRVWLDVKAALLGKDLKAILNSCEYGEIETLDAYDKALENDFKHFNAEQQTMIVAQRSLLKADHDQVKALCNALVDASIVMLKF